VVADKQVLATGGIVSITPSVKDQTEGTTRITSVNNPVDFDGTPDTSKKAVPGSFVPNTIALQSVRLQRERRSALSNLAYLFVSALGEHSIGDALSAFAENAKKSQPSRL